MILLAVFVSAQQETPKPAPPKLTAEQDARFQSALKDYYIRVAVVNNIQVQLLNAQNAANAAKAAIPAACPGQVVGLESDRAECKLPEAKMGENPTSK
jgi:hypothetical protein